MHINHEVKKSSTTKLTHSFYGRTKLINWTEEMVIEHYNRMPLGYEVNEILFPKMSVSAKFADVFIEHRHITRVGGIYNKMYPEFIDQDTLERTYINLSTGEITDMLEALLGASSGRAITKLP